MESASEETKDMGAIRSALSHFSHPRLAVIIFEGIVMGFVGFVLLVIGINISSTLEMIGRIALFLGVLTALFGLLGYGYMLFITQ